MDMVEGYEGPGQSAGAGVLARPFCHSLDHQCVERPNQKKVEWPAPVLVANEGHNPVPVTTLPSSFTNNRQQGEQMDVIRSTGPVSAVLGRHHPKYQKRLTKYERDISRCYQPVCLQ